jgi:hypothetical protein
MFDLLEHVSHEDDNGDGDRHSSGVASESPVQQ